MVKYWIVFKKMIEKLKPFRDKYKTTLFSLCFDAFICFLRYGVTPNEYIGFAFFAKSKFEKKTFYTARHAKKYEKLLNDPKFSKNFWDKRTFNETFSDFISRAWIYVPDLTEDQLNEFVKSYKKLIVKPIDGSSGMGIHIYEGDSYDNLKRSNCILEEFVVQSKKIAKINSTSLNTIRVYTILDAEGKPHILSASIRVGGAGSVVDNYHSGGVAYAIDIESGVVMTAGVDINGVSYIFHPGSGEKVVGFEIPNWAELKEFCFKACEVIPTARLIAWDVAVLENGFEMIEGNYSGDPGVMQACSKKGNLFEIKKYSRKAK